MQTVDLTLDEIELIEHALMTLRNVDIANHKNETHAGVKQMIAERLNRDNLTTANIFKKINS